MTDLPVARRLAFTGCFAGLLIAVLALIGWLAEVPQLKSLASRQVPMNPLTAVAFILCGLAFAGLLLLRGRLRIAAKVLAFGAGALAFFKLLSFFGFDLKLDQRIFVQSLDRDISLPPNRMAPNTAVEFILLTSALLLIDARSRAARGLFQASALLAASISLLVLIGYVYDSRDFIQVAYFLPMAFNTALAFFLLSLAVLCARPDVILVSTLLSPGPGGVIGRRILPAVVISPLIFGWLRVIGEREGFYGSAFGTAMIIALMILILSALILWTARSLNQSDERLQAAISEVQKLNDLLSVQNGKLQAVNSELEEFTSAVAHDLKAPLRTIIGFSEVLVTDHADGLSADAKGHLERISRGTFKMSVLIDSLLRLSKLSLKELELAEVNLSQISLGILEELARSNPSRKIVYRVDGEYRVSGDRLLLEAALTNLLGNAWKYTGRKSEAVIEFGAREINGKRAFFVSDNGAGFDMNYARKLFGVFQRLHSESEFSGTGVGLATVRRIIHRHGGRIWAEAAPDKGATFFFTLE
jgi:signal transduction histidine kinase